MKINKFKEKYKDKKEIGHVLDFLNIYYKERNINFNYEQALKKADEWTEELNKKNKDLKDSGKLEFVLEFNSGVKLVRLADQTAKNWEGLKMGHCVASYKNHDGIYSIRDKDNIPHCTIEIKDNFVEQIKGKGNGKISPKYIEYALKALNHFNYKIDENEMKNLGYLLKTKEISQSFENLKIINLDNKDFVYTGKKWKISKNPVESSHLFYELCKIGCSSDYIKFYLSNSVEPICLCTAIDLAVCNRNLDTLREILKDKRINPRENKLAIRNAASRGFLEILKELMKDKRFDPSYDRNGAIRWASINGHTTVVKELLRDPRVDPSAFQDISIRCASDSGFLEIVKELMKDPRVDPSSLSNSSLRWASENGHTEVVRELLKDIRVNPAFPENEPIRLATNHGRLEVVKELLKDGRIDVREAIKIASNKGYKEILLELSKHIKYPLPLN